MRSRVTARWRWVGVSLGVAATLRLASAAHAATIDWRGHEWNVTGGGMAGVCRGDAANVSVDASGHLHMRIANNGGTWTAAEIFSTDKIGFGTYQWQIEGPTDELDKNVVVGLFPYGPAGGLGSSGNNEIDIEFARWGNDAWPNGNYTVWPPSGSTTASHTFAFSLDGGTSITTRFTWSSTKIDFATLSGFVAVDASSGLVDSWTFAPADPSSRITQEAMPLGMNLWCFENPPSDGQDVEIVVRDFQFVPLGATSDGGAAGAGGAADVDGSGGSGGTGAWNGSAGTDAAAGDGDTGGTGGVAGRGGATTGGTPGTGGSATTGAAGGGELTAGGAAGTEGAVGTGGAGTGGARGDGSIGTGGTPGSTGTTGGSGAAGRSGTVDSAGAAGTGGGGDPRDTWGAPSRAEMDSGGCSCGVADARRAPGGRIILLAAALLFVRRRDRRKPTRRAAGHPRASASPIQLGVPAALTPEREATARRRD
jgi:MYXO-CTERM domain-containing protein